MKLSKHAWGEVGLLTIASLAGILTFAYQGWYFLIRLAIIGPLILSFFAGERLGRLLRTLCGGIGSAGFGFFVYLWSVYPAGRYLGSANHVMLGLEIALLAAFTILFVLTQAKIISSWVPLTVVWIPVLSIVVLLGLYHGFLQPAGIAVEFFSYVPFFGALGTLGKNEEKKNPK